MHNIFLKAEAFNVQMYLRKVDTSYLPILGQCLNYKKFVSIKIDSGKPPSCFLTRVFGKQQLKKHTKNSLPSPALLQA